MHFITFISMASNELPLIYGFDLQLVHSVMDRDINLLLNHITSNFNLCCEKDICGHCNRCLRTSVYELYEIIASGS